jgi:hypothetical protein
LAGSALLVLLVTCLLSLSVAATLHEFVIDTLLLAKLAPEAEASLERQDVVATMNMMKFRKILKYKVDKEMSFNFAEIEK